MEILFEIVLEFILEGSIEVLSNKKIRPIIRYPLIVFIISFFGGFVIGLFIIGLFVWNKNIFAGLLIIILSIVMLICIIYRFKKVYKEKKDKKDKL